MEVIIVSRYYDLDAELEVIASLGLRGYDIPVEEVRTLISKLSKAFRNILVENGYESKRATTLTTKFRDAGRRSAPWRPTSSRIPGRPQDGRDGNRINRWLLPEDHKFYASEVNATLVECKYILQTLSMLNAPKIPGNILEDEFEWLTGHPIIPGQYKDPIQVIDIDFEEFIRQPRSIQSGHFIPLDRGGKHYPDNTFLMLARSNQIQGNMTFEELMAFMRETLRRHNEL